jgi:CBS domain-containing protein
MTQDMLAKDIMVKDVITINEDASLKELADLLVKKKISGVPVVNTDGKVVGMVSEADLIVQDARLHFPRYIQFLDSVIYLESLSHFEEELKKTIATKVKDIMTTRIDKVSPDETMENIATTMVDKKRNRIPVFDGDRLVGIITRADVVKALSKTL